MIWPLVVALNAVLFGGCPSGGVDPGIDITIEPDIDLTVDESQAAISGTVGTLVNKPVTVRVNGLLAVVEPFSSFSVERSPQRGALSPISEGASGYELTYTPALDFTGKDELVIRGERNGAAPTLVTLRVIVYPSIRFAVEPSDTSRDATIRARAFTSNGEPLPDGQYNWTIGEHTESGKVATHSELQYRSARGGRLTVALAVALVGIPTPIDAIFGDSGNEARGSVTIWPLISGHIRDQSGNPIPGVQISTIGITAVTDSDGLYAVAVPFGWSGAVLPWSTEYEFTPTARIYENVEEDIAEQDFAGAPLTVAGFTISGEIHDALGRGVAGARVTLGDGTGSVLADANGHYEVRVAPGWSGTLTPWALGYRFNPPSRGYSNVADDIPNQAFAAQEGTYNLSGLVLDTDGQPIVNVAITGVGTGASNGLNDLLAYTSASGDYALAVPAGWSGYISAYHANYHLIPGMRAFDNVARHYSEQHFVEVLENHAPTASNLSATTAAETPIELSVTAEDVDADRLTYAIVSGPAHGSLGEVDNSDYGVGKVTYSPAPGYSGVDTFRFRANDGSLDSNVATFTITVSAAGANHPPTVSNQSTTVTTNSTATLALLGQDADNDNLTFSIVSEPRNGLLTGLDNGQVGSASVLYTPIPGFTGTDSFTFKANDGSDDSNVATFSITINQQQNDAPTVSNQTDTTNRDTVKTLSLLGQDANNDDLTFSILSGPAHGTLSGMNNSARNSASIVYTPSAGYVGVDTFTFRANDGRANSNTGTFTITVQQQTNQPPTVSNQSVTIFRDTPTQLTLNGQDANNDDLTFSVVGNPSHGTLSGLNNSGRSSATITYTPATGYVGADSFTFKASDGQAESNLATFSITVNEPPAGKIYYVNNTAANASDSNAGTEAAPFLTISKAASIVGPGDTVFVRGSASKPYKEGVSIKKNGTPSARITFKVYGTDTVIIDGEEQRDTCIAIGQSGGGVGSYVTVDGFTAIRSSANTGNAAGILMRSARESIVRNCHVYNTRSCGMRVAGLADGCVVEYNQIHNCDKAGVVVRNTDSEGRPKNTVVRWNHIHHNTGAQPEHADQVGNTGADNTLIENNLLHHAGDDCIDSVDSLNTTIRFNILYLADWVKDPNGDGNGVKLGVGGGGGHIAHHNVSFLNNNTGIQVNNQGQAGAVSYVYHNTLYGNGTKGFTTSSDSGARVFNNVSLANLSQDIKYEFPPAGVYDYCYVGANGGFETNTSPHNIGHPVDPLLNNLAPLLIDSDGDRTPDLFEPFDDPNAFPNAETAIVSAKLLVESIFTIKTISPCKNAGTPLPGINDNFLGSAPDMGAFEVP